LEFGKFHPAAHLTMAKKVQPVKKPAAKTASKPAVAPPVKAARPKQAATAPGVRSERGSAAGVAKRTTVNYVKPNTPKRGSEGAEASPAPNDGEASGAEAPRKAKGKQRSTSRSK